MRVVSVLYVSVLGTPVGPLAMVVTRHLYAELDLPLFRCGCSRL